MTMRTTNQTVTFRRPFCFKGVDRLLPPADYRVVTDAELIDGLSLFGVPARFDGHLCAGGVRLRSRDGDH